MDRLSGCVCKLSTTRICTFTALMLLLSASLLDARTLHKRNVFQMCNLINYYTQRPCYNYNDYGCFCGYGQQGIKPMDDVDRCCKKHDDCYGRVKCYFFYPQFVTYDYECDDETRTCQCMDQYQCSRTTCECDRIFAECLAWATYHDDLKNFDRVNCPTSNNTTSDSV